MATATVLEPETGSSANIDLYSKGSDSNKLRVHFDSILASDKRLANVSASDEGDRRAPDILPQMLLEQGNVDVGSESNPLSGIELTSIFKENLNDAASRESGIYKDDAGSSNGLDGHLEAKDEKPPMIPEVRKVNFEHFKNRYSEKDSNYVIDALVSGPSLLQEVQYLHNLRKRQNSKRYKNYVLQPPLSVVSENTWIQRIRLQSPGVILHLAKVVGQGWSGAAPRTFFRLFRVFIYFQDKMKEILRKLETKREALEKSNEFQKTAIQELDRTIDEQTDKAIEQEPISALEQEVDLGAEEEVNKLPVKTAGMDTEKGTGVLSNETEATNTWTGYSTDDSDTESEADTWEDPIMHSAETLKAMRCYVTFVDKEIMPLYKMFDGTLRTKIRFEDLWLLFRAGELVYASSAADIRRGQGQARNRDLHLTQSTTVWRVFALVNPLDYEEYPSFEKRNRPRSEVGSDANTDDEDEFRSCKLGFRVWCYYIDFDGVSYGPVKNRFSISRFEGEIDIRSLPCYPIRYVKDRDLLANRKRHGAKFKQSINNTHNTYHGWSAAVTPSGKPITYDEDGKDLKYPEFIESHVIVDFVEAFRAYPFWKPQFYDTKAYSDDGHWIVHEDEYPIIDWRTRDRTRESIQSDDGVVTWQRWETLEKDEFIRAYKAQATPGSEKVRIELEEEDLVLLPKRLFAYVLRDRKFAVLDVRSLEPIPPQQNAFDRLKTLTEYKDIVRGLVASHFTKKDLERKVSALSRMEKRNLARAVSGLSTRERTDLTRSKSVRADMSLRGSAGNAQEREDLTLSSLSAEGLSQDVIEGKGQGLVILLHGVPGVGKTATAEAVALENRKPLFAITCGDLGLTPSDVEHHLTEVFRLAHLWDCVLLLDEADVFLSSRSNLDLNRNALVSVFLRVLEHYSGILFLTTNRVGHMDEAFKSRIHISLYYQPLSPTQAVEIFKVNIKRLRETAKIRSQIANEPELTIEIDRILEFADQFFNFKLASNAIPWNGRQIRNAFQIASSLAYNTMHNEYAQRLAKVNKGQLPQAQYPVPFLDEAPFKIVAGVTDDFDKYMKEARGRDDADRAWHHGERADRLKIKHKLALPKFVSSEDADLPMFDRRGMTPPSTDTPTHRFALPKDHETPSQYGMGSQHHEEFESDDPGPFAGRGPKHDVRSPHATPEVHHTRRHVTSELFDDQMHYTPSFQSADQGRSHADIFTRNAARNPPGNTPNATYIGRSELDYENHPPAGYRATPPQLAMTPPAEAQYDSWGQSPLSPSPGRTRRKFDENDPSAYN